MAQTTRLASFGPVFDVVDVVVTCHTDNVTIPTTRDCGYGFSWIWVRVALENPRVARDTPYKQKRWPDWGLNPGPSRHIPDALTTELSGLYQQIN